MSGLAGNFLSLDQKFSHQVIAGNPHCVLLILRGFFRDKTAHTSLYIYSVPEEMSKILKFFAILKPYCTVL